MDLKKNVFNDDNELKVLSLFSGIGAYEKALKNIGINYELINYCEFNRIKSKAYSLLHDIPESKNLWDVRYLDTETIKDFDLLIYSPPCQSFSIAGNRQGTEDKRGTLFYAALKVIHAKKPKYCIMENVDNLANEFKDEFNKMLDSLEKEGYKNYWKIINAKDFIPQNRKRLYLVSIRSDIEDKFEFPIGKDNRNWWDIIDVKEHRNLTNRQQRMINYVLGINKKDNIRVEGKIQFDNAVITLRQSGIRFQNNREHPAIIARYGTGGSNFSIIAKDGIYGGITPRQCFKLMGFDYEDSDLLTQNGFSVSNQYIMVGDSVAVPVLEGILKNLLL